MNEQAQKIQALLFIAGEAVPITELAELLQEPVETVATYLDELETTLGNHGVVLIRTNTHAGLATAPSVAGYLAAFQKEQLGGLTKAASETLSIIAYKGPISRYDIDALRGVDSRAMIRALTRRGIIAKIQEGGRIPLYDITDEFLLHLGITKREELPDFETLSNNATIERILNEQDTPKKA